MAGWAPLLEEIILTRALGPEPEPGPGPGLGLLREPEDRKGPAWNDPPVDLVEQEFPSRYLYVAIAVESR